MFIHPVTILYISRPFKNKMSYRYDLSYDYHFNMYIKMINHYRSICILGENKPLLNGDFSLISKGI